MRHFVAYTDGGSRGNPGPAASSFVLYETFTDGSRHHLVTKGFYIGEQTNNVAEYAALEYLLAEMNQMDPGNCSLTVFADSLLMVNQVKGLWAVKNPILKVHVDDVHTLSYKIASVEIHHTARENNKVADAACNTVLDSVEKATSPLKGPVLRMEMTLWGSSASGVCANFSNV